MTLTELIQVYSDLKAAYDQDLADYEQLVMTRIPQEKNNLAAAEIQVTNAKSALRSAETAIDVQSGRDAVVTAEEGVNNLIQLINNLDAKVKKWEGSRSVRQDQVARARKEMWESKQNELMDQLVLSAEMIALMEDIIAAKDGINPGWKSRSFGDLINEKLPIMPLEDATQRREALMVDMGL